MAAHSVLARAGRQRRRLVGAAPAAIALGLAGLSAGFSALPLRALRPAGAGTPRHPRSPRCRVAARVSHRVTLEMPGGKVVEFDCPETSTILGEAEELGYELPYSCLTGQCSVCTGRVLDGGEVDQSKQTFLTEEQVEDSYVLTCVCYPRSDVRLQTHCDSDVAAFKAFEGGWCLVVAQRQLRTASCLRVAADSNRACLIDTCGRCREVRWGLARSLRFLPPVGIVALSF
ncbi:unnamed protein product [Prorocentrum cordatum]|uniref:Ferredoxin n=1 Tax=Prorocentrum cordatum TaxID=2364126 RepID=A0ABN9RFA1_9DINO|nr:unnamed protein product [Polarella glacialis]